MQFFRRNSLLPDVQLVTLVAGIRPVKDPMFLLQPFSSKSSFKADIFYSPKWLIFFCLFFTELREDTSLNIILVIIGPVVSSLGDDVSYNFIDFF